MKHRQPPAPPFKDSPAGVCRLCGGQILTKDEKPNKARRWCVPCGRRWRIAKYPEIARAAVYIRDSGVCALCGTDGTSYPATYDGRGYQVQLDKGWLFERCLLVAEGKRLKLNGTLPPLGNWQADHVIPLWCLDEERAKSLVYWGLDNLQTLCPDCHAIKTEREAAQRAKMKRLRAKRLGKKSRPKRKIPSRPFPKRPGRSVEAGE